MSLWQGLLSEGVVVRLGWTLVHFLWQATAVALLLALLLRLLRRATANLRYAAACGTLLLMMAMPLVTMQFIDVPGPVAEGGPSLEVVTPPMPVVMQTVDALPPLPAASPIEVADLTVSVPWRQRLATALEPALPYIVLGWLAGVFGLSAWHLGGWAQLQRLRRRMVREAGDTLHTTLDELATRLRVRRAVTLLESALVEVPTVVGWLSPTILLPASALTGLSPDQLKAILAHELAHIRRYDYLANIVQTVVEILGFYHPAVWWVSHRIRIERENCCDDLAVRVCDNSLQYARALASMEEIRHSRSELAMAASGGSLMARIARLLGRPVVDDRRFTWLPGLIALLLVVGVVIPAAFALTRSAPREPESQGDATSASATESQGAPDSPESTQTQIQVTLVLAELYADAVLDPQTAEEAAGLLVRISAHDGESIPPPTREELRRPLADVLSTFTPAPGRAREFVDLLRRKKDCVARTLSAPRVTSLSGESLQFTMGDIPSPDEPLPQDDEFIFVRCAMTATQVSDQNAVRMAIDMVRMYPAYEPSEPNGRTATWTLDTTMVAANNEWMTIADKLLRRLDSSGRKCIQLPLVLATIVPNSEARDMDAPGTVPMIPSADGTIHLPPGMGGLRPTTSPDPIAAPQPSVPAPDEPARTQVLLAFTVLDVVTDRPLDADAAAQARHSLMREQPTEGSTASASAVPPLVEELLLPLRDIFTRFAPIPEKSKELTDLLISSGYATILSKPMILTFADEPTSLSLGEPDDPNAANGYIRLSVTAHVLDDRDATRLEIDYRDRRAIDDSDDPNRPMSSTQIASTLVVPNDEYAAIVGLNPSAPADNMRILLIGPTKVYRPQRAAEQDPNANAQSRSDEPNSSSTAGSTAQAEESRSRPRQILLDTRVVEIDHSSLASRGVEWDSALQTISLGDKPFADTLLARLNQLEATKQAQIVSHPQLVALDGRMVQLRSFEQEWFMTTDPSASPAEFQQKTESGTILNITPHAGDSNEITVDVEVEIIEVLQPERGPGDLPIVTRRKAQSRITVRNGGTAAIAGSVNAPGMQKDKAPKENVILVTASLVPETSEVTHPVQTGRARAAQSEDSGALYGRVLFEDGTPAVLQPAPRPGAHTRIALAMKGRSTEVAQVDDEGYFVLRLEDTQREALAAHREGVHLCIDLPTDRKYPWEGVGVFPFEKLAKTRQDAGTITVRRTLPTITLPIELRRGGPLPDGWRLEYRPTPATGRIEEILFNAEVVDSHLGLKVGELPGDEEFVVYDPNGKEVERFRSQSMMAMYKTVRYTLIGRKGEGRNADDWRIVHGPYILDMTRSGWYKLTIDLGAIPEADSQDEDPSGVTPSRHSTITTAFTNIDLLKALGEISRCSGVTIAVDLAVKPQPITVELVNASVESAIRQILKGTPYTFKRQPETEPATYLIYRPITATFEDADLPEVLRDIARKAEVPIIVDPDVHGRASAQFEDVQLEKALEIVLAGTPYKLKRTASHYLVAEDPSATRLPPLSQDQRTSPGQEQAPSQAWTIMQRAGCPPLLLGLTQQLAKVLDPSRQNDPAWKEVNNGGTLRVQVDVGGKDAGEVLIGLFADARWPKEPVAVRRVAGSGEHVLTGLPAGQYQIGAMIGKPPVATMLGVQRQWPQEVEIVRGQTRTAEVFLSEAFQQWASGWYNEGVSKDYLGDWSGLHQNRQLQGQLLGPDGQPIRFGEVLVREYKDPSRRQGGIAAPNIGTSEQGY